MIRPERFEGKKKVPGRFIRTRNDSVETSLVLIRWNEKKSEIEARVVKER